MAEGDGDTAEKERIHALYERLARSYDWTVPLLRLAGFREQAYRRELVAGLALRPGDTVVDLACGTGRSFPYLRRAVGPAGTVVGVDFSGPMLAQAQHRIARRGWDNVTLVQAEAARFVFPEDVRAIAAAAAIGAMADYEAVIARACEALPPGGRLGLLELTYPERWPRWLADLGVGLMAPYGATPENARRRPWEAMAGRLEDLEVRERYFGAVIIAIGTRPDRSAPPIKKR